MTSIRVEVITEEVDELGTRHYPWLNQPEFVGMDADWQDWQDAMTETCIQWCSENGYSYSSWDFLTDEQEQRVMGYYLDQRYKAWLEQEKENE